MKRRRRKNPLDERTWLLVGVASVLALGVGYVLWANPAEASTATTWPVAQFATSPYMQQVTNQPGNILTGGYALLRDASSGVNVIAQVAGVSGGVGTGVVAYAPSGAPESRGDQVTFNVADVLQSSESMALLAA